MAERAIGRAFSILRFCASQSSTVGVQQVADNLGLGVSTAHRLLRSMVATDILSYDPASRRYGIGNEVRRLAVHVLADSDETGIIRQHLLLLARDLRDTVVFNEYVRPGTMNVSIVARGPEILQYEVEVGRTDPLHAGASGKAILAFLPEKDRERYLTAGPLARVTDATVTEPDRLRNELDDIREEGFAISHGERIDGAVGVAAPVFDVAGHCRGSVLVTIPAFRATADALSCASGAVTAAARAIRMTAVIQDDLTSGARRKPKPTTKSRKKPVKRGRR